MIVVVKVSTRNKNIIIIRYAHFDIKYPAKYPVPIRVSFAKISKSIFKSNF